MVEVPTHVVESAADAEGEKQVRGDWIGQGAEKLGREGAVTDAPFEALRENRDWQTGERLTARGEAISVKPIIRIYVV